MLYGHPFWKFINCISSLWVLNSFDSNDNISRRENIYQPVYGSNRNQQTGNIQCFYSLMSIGYFMIIFGGAIPALIVIVPALILYCPFIAGIACCLAMGQACWRRIAIKCSSLLEIDYDKYGMVWMLGLICFIYMIIVILTETMICIYIEGTDDGGYIGCLGKAFEMDYCPYFVFDASNWQAWILLLTWIFF